MFMKCIYLISTLCLLVACNRTQTNGEKTVTLNADTVSRVDISIHKADTVLSGNKPAASVLLMKLYGSVASWYGEVYNDHLRLLVDGGKDSLVVHHNFESSLSTTGFVASVCIAQTVKAKLKEVSLTLHITQNPCVEPNSNSVRKRSVVMLYDKKTYKGCGEIIHL